MCLFCVVLCSISSWTVQSAWGVFVSFAPSIPVYSLYSNPCPCRLKKSSEANNVTAEKVGPLSFERKSHELWKLPSTFIVATTNLKTPHRHAMVDDGSWFGSAGKPESRKTSLFGVGLGPGVVGGRNVVCSTRHIEYREPSSS